MELTKNTKVMMGLVAFLLAVASFLAGTMYAKVQMPQPTNNVQVTPTPETKDALTYLKEQFAAQKNGTPVDMIREKRADDAGNLSVVYTGKYGTFSFNEYIQSKIGLTEHDVVELMYYKDDQFIVGYIEMDSKGNKQKGARFVSYDFVTDTHKELFTVKGELFEMHDVNLNQDLITFNLKPPAVGCEGPDCSLDGLNRDIKKEGKVGMWEYDLTKNKLEHVAKP